MLINWFSPLPPSSTDISQYTRRILPDLSKKADIRLWTENKEYDPYLADWAEVIVYDKNKRWEPFWQKLNEGDVNFYNIGNNVNFHREIWQVCSRAPGIVILHDIALQDFFCGIFFHDGDNRDDDMEIYKNHMTKFYGAYIEVEKHTKNR